jgi:hypothetical protein
MGEETNEPHEWNAGTKLRPGVYEARCACGWIAEGPQQLIVRLAEVHTKCQAKDEDGQPCPNVATRTATKLAANGEGQDMRWCQMHYETFRTLKPPRVGPARRRIIIPTGPLVGHQEDSSS